MRLLKALSSLALMVIIFLVVLIVQDYYSTPPEKILGYPTVIDGDTLNFRGRRVRIYGIDAPELEQYCLSLKKETPCGRYARLELLKLVKDQGIECTVQTIDQYNRFVAVCTKEGQDIGKEMVKRGHAVSYGAYRTEEAEAKQEKRGLWNSYFERPQEWRRTKTLSPFPYVLSKPVKSIFLNPPARIIEKTKQKN